MIGKIFEVGQETRKKGRMLSSEKLMKMSTFASTYISISDFYLLRQTKIDMRQIFGF